jgi:hypothetical protein
MNTEFEAHRSDFPGFPEGPFVLVAGRLQSEPDLALSAPKCVVLAGGRIAYLIRSASRYS